MDIKNDSCKKYFHELIEKKCIIKSQIIEESKDCVYFCAKPPNVIRYNSSMNRLNENSIKFSLLHEENHNQHPYRPIVLFLFFSILFIVIFWISQTKSSSLSVPFLIILIFFICVIGIAIFRNNEYECDKFAAIILKNKLGVQEPLSDVLEKTLEIMKSKKWWSILIHPSDQNRVKHIAENIDQKIL